MVAERWIAATADGMQMVGERPAGPPDETEADDQKGGVEAALERVVTNPEEVPDTDRTSVLSFLSGMSPDDGGYAPQRGEIASILRKLGDETTADLNALKAVEGNSSTRLWMCRRCRRGRRR